MLMTTGSVRCWGQNVHGQASAVQRVWFAHKTCCRCVPEGSLYQVACVLYYFWHLTLALSLLPFTPLFCFPSPFPIGSELLLCSLLQLGDGTSATSVMSPPGIDALTSVAAIATGGFHTCALMLTGGMRCWGHNEYGQASAVFATFFGSCARDFLFHIK